MRLTTLLSFLGVASLVHGRPADPNQKEPSIVGGTLANIKDFPFMAALRVRNNPKGFFCGGTLISRTRVLSAAHCLDDGAPASRYEVRVGSSDQTTGGTVIRVAAYHIHPDWNATTNANDVAVLELASAAPSSLQCADLPSRNALPAAESDLRVLGWGATSTGNGAEKLLRKATIKALPDALCANRYTNYDPPDQLCAGVRDGSKDTCQGDSGGPAIQGTCTVVGITSYGRLCGSAVDPGVYTSVSHYLSYIQTYL